jgi:hypothetical protein
VFVNLNYTGQDGFRNVWPKTTEAEVVTFDPRPQTPFHIGRNCKYIPKSVIYALNVAAAAAGKIAGHVSNLAHVFPISLFADGCGFSNT